MRVFNYEKRNRFIFINDNLCIEQQKFECSRELGHTALHTKFNNKKEYAHA
ncbi:ImmA/IrrE family metallo-endopeptidase [Bacillus andreraoultii]|uniref:ImmA/IrrE family metallo-endopeptidase n=1 Tax=Bacillus andreraoultii TaxID=1499685 RepID=UPI0009E412A8